MVFDWNQRKRRHKRYNVFWEALLEVETADFHEYLPVPLINISQSGALFYSENVTLNNQHLAVAGHNNELNLIIHTPANELDSKISIKRYLWNNEISGFEIGVEFKDKSKKNKEFTHWLEKNIRHYHQPVFMADNEPVYID